MILLRRLGGPQFTLNPDLIERAEATPDTVITMVGGNKYVVCEALEELSNLIRQHRARILATAEALAFDSSLWADATTYTTESQQHVRSVDPSTDTVPPVVPLRRRHS